MSGHRQKRSGSRKSSSEATTSAAVDLSHIAEPLRAFAVPTSTLNLDQNNPNIHTDEQIEAIMETLRELGQDELLIFRPDGRIVTHGNGRLIAARRLVDEGDPRFSMIAAFPIDEDQERSLMRGVAHNALPRRSSFNRDILANIVKTIADAKANIKAIGLEDDDVARLMERLKGDKPAGPPSSTKQVRFNLPRREYERLVNHLKTFDDDRDRAFLLWLQQSMKGARR